MSRQSKPANKTIKKDTHRAIHRQCNLNFLKFTRKIYHNSAVQ